MKGQSRLFLTLAILALAFFVSSQLLLRSLASRAVSYDGEPVFGERSAAAGLTVERVSVLSDHLVWESVWDAAAGTGTTHSRWHLAQQYEWPPVRVPGIAFEFGADTAWYTGGQQELNRVQREITADVLALYDGSGDFSTVIDLSDYLERYDVTVSLRNMTGTDGAVLFPYDVLDGLFDVGVPDGMDYEAAVYESDDGLRVSLHPLGRLYGSYVFAPEGGMYFTFTVAAGSGEQPDGSQLPGGSRGVWRIPCSVDAAARPDGERWWAEGEFYASADPEGLENVYLLPGSCADVRLDLSRDGTRVLVFTAEDGAVWLTVLDAVTGDVTQRLELFPAALVSELGLDTGFQSDGALRCFHREDSSVVVLGERLAAALNYEDCGYTLRFTADALAGARYESFYSLDYAFDGERLAALTGCSGYVQVLNLFDSSGLIYSELLPVSGPFPYFDDTVTVDLS